MTTPGAKTLTVAPVRSDFGKNLWVRTAAGPRIGFGHLRRCFVLAEALQDCCTPVFLLDCDDLWTGEQITKKGWKLVCGDLDTVWASAPQPAGILIDTRVTTGLDEFVAAAKLRGIPVISIHDLGLSPLASDVAVDGSIVQTCGDAFPPDCKFCSGTDFMVLDPVYGRLHQRSRAIRKRIHSVFVNLGGGDSGEYFLKVVEGLRLCSRDLDVIGVSGFVAWGQESLGRRDWNPLRFRWETRNIEQYLFKADLAITAGGLSAYEALCAGTPLAAFSYDALQQSTITALAGKGACVDLGPGEKLDPLKISGVLALLDSSIDQRRNLSICGRALVDGRGVERVAELIRQEIRQVAAEEHWRSDVSGIGL